MIIILTIKPSSNWAKDTLDKSSSFDNCCPSEKVIISLITSVKEGLQTHTPYLWITKIFPSFSDIALG